MEKYINKRRGEDGLLIYYIEHTSCCGNYVEWRHGAGSTVCPFCGNKYYKKPNLEMRLFTLQDEFISDFEKTGSTRILGEQMFPLIQEYAKNLIKALLHGKTSLDGEELEMRSWDASTLLVEVIMKESDHRMRYSFGDYLGRLCKSVCYSTKNHDRTYSLNSMLLDDKTELGETITANLTEISGGKEVGSVDIDNVFELAIPDENFMQKLLDAVQYSVDKLFYIKDTRQRLLYLQGLLLKFNKNACLIKNFYDCVGQELVPYINKGRDIIYSRLA